MTGVQTCALPISFIQDNNGNYQSYGSYGFGGDYSGDAIWVIY